MSSFHERQKSLFQTLEAAEEQYSFSKTNKAETPNDYGVIDRRTYKKIKHDMKQFRNRESIFKRPEASLRQCLRPKTVPDHIKNPKGYVYYSLADVTSDQMSDASNTSTALALIREMEDRQANEIKMEEDSADDAVFKKPTFCISARVKKEQPEEEEKIVFKSNKMIMPEYVVGAAQKKIKKERLVKEPKNSADKIKNAELKLQHLYEEED
ncbi:hypothetical protein JYU34_021057 [Plutella xylostella]|uniref:Uncharacterized protein n=2 Tax=Plutella xylostella TaxID=51655 RepID=A0ABQ7PSL8_PLUXY|nr:uncharacterized protein LOC105393983 [Plutella xylostella]KAG7295967.1 hypothetical protein JYU34_021057 [Plutella xylostella]CAG9088440.1 unnamed protein product [Plutella xylostella]